MGSLHAALPLKQRPTSPPAPPPQRSFFHCSRSRVARFLLLEKVDFLQWALAAAVFFVALILFQYFLPGSVVERAGGQRGEEDLGGEIRHLDFGEGIRFVPMKLMERLEREKMEASSAVSELGRPVTRAGLRPPRIAVVRWY